MAQGRAERARAIPARSGEVGHGAHGDAPVRDPHPPLFFVVHHDDGAERLPVTPDAGFSEQERPDEIARLAPCHRFTDPGRLRHRNLPRVVVSPGRRDTLFGPFRTAARLPPVRGRPAAAGAASERRPP